MRMVTKQKYNLAYYFRVNFIPNYQIYTFFLSFFPWAPEYKEKKLKKTPNQHDTMLHANWLAALVFAFAIILHTKKPKTSCDTFLLSFNAAESAECREIVLFH